MRWAQRRRQFRSVLAAPSCIHAGSVFDPLSARIAEDLGFAVGSMAGSVASLVVLGAPDLVLLTLTEFADQIRRITRAAALPLMVDADHGYGNALNVMRTVEELEAAGVAGLTIEDTLLPAPYGSTGKMELISIEEGVGKLGAALAARTDPDLVIIGRTSALAIAGDDEGLRRIQAYARTGVDAMQILGVRTRAQLERIADTIGTPIILGPLTPELADLDYLASQHVRITLQGHGPFMAALKAVRDTMAALRGGTAPAALPKGLDAETLQRLTRQGDYDAWTRDFLATRPASRE